LIQELKKILIFGPIFLFFYGVNTYGLHAVSLYENPLGSLESEQWVQESPIQFFIGYFINLIVDNTTTTHWIVVAIGFLYLYTSAYFFDKYYFKKNQIFKILYFTPFFLILFTWMGKPDTFTIGSLFFLVAFNNSVLLSNLFILFTIFSHPQIAFVYFVLIKFLKIFEYKKFHYLGIFINFIIYTYYRSQLYEFDDRFTVISNELDRVFRTIFTNTFGGLISLFMWLWIVIFISKLIKDKKFIVSFLFVFSISFFTIDHTRVFMQLSIPLVIYMIQSEEFLNAFYRIFNNKLMYILGIFQIQKRADGKLVDGKNIYEISFFNDLFNFIIKNITQIIEKF